MQAVQTIGSLRPQRRRRSKHVVTMAIFKKLLLPLLLVLTVMFAVFLPTGADVTDNIVMSVNASSQTAQSAAHTLYSVAATTRDSNDGGQTKVDLSGAYVDAAAVIAPYNSGLVQDKSGLIVGTNSPTREVDENHAYVVNVSQLLEAEIQDIITFEQQTLGLSGHRPAEEYAREKLPIAKSITAHYGAGTRDLWYGAVAPAVTIRNFYAEQKYTGYPTGAGEYFACFGGADNAYLDAMLVKDEDVDAYFAGQDVPVVYAQFRMFSGNSKAHSAPWGITQTYFQMNKGGTMQPNTSMGGFTPQEYGTVPITGDAPRDLANLLDMAKGYAADGRSVYWWPTVLAGRQELGFGTAGNLTGVTSSTANIFESYSTDQLSTLLNEYAGHSLVGILVYAVQ